MNKLLIEKILERMDHGLIEYAIRDITYLTCSIFNQTHLISFKEHFSFDGFTMIFWYTRPDNNVVFYRSGREYGAFCEQVGERYLNEKEFAESVAQNLREMSDEINRFIDGHKTRESFLNDVNTFTDLYRDFFAYHQAVYWPTEYLLSSGKVALDDELVELMNDAYAYNENVVPRVEQYFIDLEVADYSVDEVRQLHKGNQDKLLTARSSLLLDGEARNLSQEEAGEIDQAIQADYKKYLESVRRIEGVSAYDGKVNARVKVITDLGKLGELEEGNILVTTQTRPQFNSVLRKAKAIVTDEGGMLCHAALLAREFKIPCIVGTKIATQILKDDDLVEVDANNGTVKVIKSIGI